MELHKGCILCKEKNVAKHDIIDDHTGKIIIKRGEFVINCDGIPADPEAHLVSITDPRVTEAVGGEDALRQIARMQDPVLWAQDNIVVPDMETKVRQPWTPQGATKENIELYDLSPDAEYYQEIMAKCTARRQLYRIGRRSGKTWTLIAKVLHRMYTAPGGKYRILVITPNIAQLDIIFSTARDFISMSPTIHNTVARYVKSPQRYLELTNGSFMRGFVSGNESIRGQAADMIVIDEGDYLTTDDLSAIIAILSEHKDTVLCVSSTPSGARETFWKWDQHPKFRSFHFPSMCRPLWDEGMEVEQRIENPGVKFIHEILAEYGEISEGVFQHTDIDEALEDGDFKYEDSVPMPGWVYTMGVDWNPVHGTEIYVIGADTTLSSPEYTIVDHGQVFREGNTQIQAVNEIIRLNRIWNPSAIFVDRGAGSVQIELLNEVGRLAQPNTADKRLESILEPIDFGSKIEMRHPSTGLIQKVYAKPAVVENAIRMFESKQIRLSKYDTELIRQLRGYIVDKIAANGRPSYKMISDDIEDHKLDALILGLFAFTLKFSKFGQPDIIPVVGFARQPGAATIKILESLKPKSRDIHKSSESKLSPKEEQAEKELGFIRPSDIRHTSDSENFDTSHLLRSRLSQREQQGSKPRRQLGRAPIRRSNIPGRGR